MLQVLTIRGVLGALVISIFVKLTGRQLTISSSYPFLAASRVVYFCRFFVFLFCFKPYEVGGGDGVVLPAHFLLPPFQKLFAETVAIGLLR